MRSDSHFITTVLPCVMACELENNKYYISITRNVNEQLAKYRSSSAPKFIWIRENPFRKVLELEADGNLHSLRQMIIYYIHQYGFENVRSTANPSGNNHEPPAFYTEFCEIYKPQKNFEKTE